MLYDLAATPFGLVAVGHAGPTDLSPVIHQSRRSILVAGPSRPHGDDTLLVEVIIHGEWTYAIGDKVFACQDRVNWLALDSPGSFGPATVHEGKVFAAEGSEVIELPYPPLKTGGRSPGRLPIA